MTNNINNGNNNKTGLLNFFIRFTHKLKNNVLRMRKEHLRVRNWKHDVYKGEYFSRIKWHLLILTTNTLLPLI